MKDLSKEKTLPNAVKYDEQVTAVIDVTIGHYKSIPTTNRYNLGYGLVSV